MRKRDSLNEWFGLSCESEADGVGPLAHTNSFFLFVRDATLKRLWLPIIYLAYFFFGSKCSARFTWLGHPQATPDPDSVPKGMPRPPDGGCVGYVLRNGFQTAQVH